LGFYLKVKAKEDIRQRNLPLIDHEWVTFAWVEKLSKVIWLKIKLLLTQHVLMMMKH